MKNFGPENFFPIANAGQIIAKTLGKPLPASSQCPPVHCPASPLLNYKPDIMKRDRTRPSDRTPSRPELMTGRQQSKGPAIMLRTLAPSADK